MGVYQAAYHFAMDKDPAGSRSAAEDASLPIADSTTTSRFAAMDLAWI